MTGNSPQPDGSELWLAMPASTRARAEAQDAPLASVITAVADRAHALGLTAADLAGVLGISESEWLVLLHRWPHGAASEWLDTSLRLLCELLGSVLRFADKTDGACWLRTHHPAMGDSPLGRLISSPLALPWLSAILLEERGR